MKKFLNEFKTFAMRSSVVDMAADAITGGTSGKTVTPPVNDIIMPSIGFLSGGVNSRDLSIKLGEKLSENGKIMEAVTVNYGNSIQQIVDFLIIVFYIFLLVKAVMKLIRKNEEEPEPTRPEPTAEEKLLTEIRDLLKNKQIKFFVYIQETSGQVYHLYKPI